MNDFAFISAFAAYNCATFTSGVSWLMYGSQAGHRYDETKRQPSSFTLSWVYALSFVPWVLAWWCFARTQFGVPPAYYVSMSLVIVGLACEKIWLACVMQWNRPTAATLFALITALFYLGATIAAGTTGGTKYWEHVPAIVMTALATLWFGFISIQ
jgi:hypothetical protein